MIMVKLMGGLGNQMFQYAFGLSQAHKHETVLKLDISTFQDYKLRKYELNQFNIKENIASKKEINTLKYVSENILRKIIRKLQKKKKPFAQNYYIEKYFHYNLEIESHLDNMYYEGYWQSERYFAKYRDILLKEFTLKYPLDDNSKQHKNKILNTNSISLHIRRGDYVSNPKTNKTHGTCELTYYQNAYKYIKSKIRNPIFFIFSDDLKWCRENLDFVEDKIFIELDKSVHDSVEMYLMSRCKHNIIANSSFSWWGAWLNQNPQKIVIAPQKWFNDTSKNTSDLIPENWIKL